MNRPASIRRALALIVATVATAAAPAAAFNIIASSANNHAGALLPPTTLPATGVFRHWDLREFDNCQVPYAIHQGGTGDIAGVGDFTAIEAAANSWNAVTPALIGLGRQVNTGTSLPGLDQENVIAFDNANNSGLFGAAPSSTLGVTCIFTQVATGRIQESDIIFNDRDFQWNTNGNELTGVLSGVQPFNVNNGQTLTISVDGGANQTVTFAAVTNGAATANQIGQNIINQVAGVNVFIVGGNQVRVTSVAHNGTGTIDVNGGTAQAAIGFPAGAVLTDAADVETIALHELGHLLGIHHSSNASPEPNATYSNAVMYWAAPNTGTKRVLTGDDTNALNFLYTPDLGDAPDNGAQMYQSLVHTAANSRLLNGVQLHTPGIGPVHLFGYFPEDTLRLEWLGDTEDGHAAECEARVTDLDVSSDDGVSFPFPMFRTVPNVVTVTISYKNAARYNSAIAGRRLMFNGYFDWNLDMVFDNSDLEIWWSGDPTNGTFSNSPNWTSAFYGTAGKIILTFDVTPPAAAPSTYARFRLDLGEDEGRVANINGDLGPAIGVAQFGEVEDYRIATTNPPPTAVTVGRFEGTVAEAGIDLVWSTPEGGVSTRAALYRAEVGGEERLLAVVDAGPDGGRYHDAEVTPGASYTYRLGLFGDAGEVAGPSLRVRVPEAVLSLAGMTPNPTAGSGTVTFSLPRAGQTRIALYAVDGRRARQLADGVFAGGVHRLEWDGLDDTGHRLAPGVYYIRLTCLGETRVSRILVVR